MKICVLGATGGSGQQVVVQALARGHHVKALVRKPEAFPLSSPDLEVIKGELQNFAALAQALNGCDAVISALGTGYNLKPTDLYSTSARMLSKAMPEAGIRRLIVVSSAGAIDTNRDPLWYRFVVKPLIRHLNRDVQRMENQLRLSELDWTFVRPSYLNQGMLTGKYRTAVETSRPVKGWQISRADLAHFMLDALEQGTFVRKAVAVTY